MWELARRLFIKEAEILEKLGQHDQIPQLLAHFEEGIEFCLVQELVVGRPSNP
jgi:serine/threonine-protein kinase